MSCTFWNMRRRQRAKKLAEQTDKMPKTNVAEKQETNEAVNDNADKRTGRKPKVRHSADGR